MSTLTLSLATTKRYVGFCNSNDYVVLKSGRMIGRIMLIREDRRAIHGSGRSLRWSSALGLFSDARTGDGRFQGVMVGANAIEKSRSTKCCGSPCLRPVGKSLQGRHPDGDS